MKGFQHMQLRAVKEAAEEGVQRVGVKEEAAEPMHGAKSWSESRHPVKALRCRSLQTKFC